MNQPRGKRRRWLLMIAWSLLISGAGLSAPPIAHAITGRVSAARAKTLWSEWKRSFAAAALHDATAPGRPALWLRVPACKLSLLTLYESDSDALHRFPAVRRVENNGATVVSAHRDTHFRPLERIRQGDIVTAETPDGRTERYEVRAIRVLLPEQVPAAVEDPELSGALHLLTCYPFRFLGPAPKRLLVTALPTTRERVEFNR